MSPSEAWIYTWIVEVLMCCGLAAWKGGPFERIGAAIILAGWILSVLFQSHTGKGPGFGVVAVDVGALIALAILTAKSRRLWTLFAFACQLNAMAAHFGEYFTGFGLFSYLTDLGLWSGDGLVLCVLVGIVAHRRREKRILRMAEAGISMPSDVAPNQRLSTNR